MLDIIKLSYIASLLSFSLIGERISQQAIVHPIDRGFEVPTILTSLSEKTRKSNHLPMSMYKARADFHFFKGGVEISGGVQVAPLSELRQELKIFTQNRRGEAKFWWG